MNFHRVDTPAELAPSLRNRTLSASAGAPLILFQLQTFPPRVIILWRITLGIRADCFWVLQEWNHKVCILMPASFVQHYLNCAIHSWWVAVYVLINILNCIIFNNTYTLISLIQSYRYRNVSVYFNTLIRIGTQKKVQKSNLPPAEITKHPLSCDRILNWHVDNERHIITNTFESFISFYLFILKIHMQFFFNHLRKEPRQCGSTLCLETVCVCENRDLN